MTRINLETFADGALAEKLNIELQKVIDNIADPNTDPKKARKVTVTLTLKGNENRTLTNVVVDAKSSLAPAKGVTTEMMIDYDAQGKPVAAELKSGIPGQTYISEDGEILSDKGEPIPAELEQSNKIVKFK